MGGGSQSDFGGSRSSSDARSRVCSKRSFNHFSLNHFQLETRSAKVYILNAHDRFRTESKGNNGVFQARRETHKRCKNTCKTQKNYKSQTQKHPSTFDLASRLKVQQTSILCTTSIRNRCFRPAGQPQAPSQDRFKTEMEGKRWHPQSTCEAQNTCKNA